MLEVEDGGDQGPDSGVEQLEQNGEELPDGPNNDGLVEAVELGGGDMVGVSGDIGWVVEGFEGGVRVGWSLLGVVVFFS